MIVLVREREVHQRTNCRRRRKLTGQLTVNLMVMLIPLVELAESHLWVRMDHRLKVSLQKAVRRRRP